MYTYDAPLVPLRLCGGSALVERPAPLAMADAFVHAILPGREPPNHVDLIANVLGLLNHILM